MPFGPRRRAVLQDLQGQVQRPYRWVRAALARLALRQRAVLTAVLVGLLALLTASGLVSLLLLHWLTDWERRQVQVQVGSVAARLAQQRTEMLGQAQLWAMLPDPLTALENVVGISGIQGIVLMRGAQVTQVRLAPEVTQPTLQVGGRPSTRTLEVQNGTLRLYARAPRPGGEELLLVRTLSPADLSAGQFELGFLEPSGLDGVWSSADTVLATLTVGTLAGGGTVQLLVSQPRTLYQQGRALLVWLEIGLILILVLSVGVAMLVLDRLIFQPVSRLRRFVERLAAEPNTAARLQLDHARHEVVLFAEALNSALDQVRGDHDTMRAQGEALRCIAEGGSLQDVMQVLQAALDRVSPGAVAAWRALSESAQKDHQHIDSTTWTAVVRGRGGEMYGLLRLTYPTVVPDTIAAEAAWMADLLGVAAEQERLRLHLSRHAYHDELTGLHNRRGLLRALEQVLPEALAQNRMLAVLYVDLDRFKRLNDTLGHAAGDELLRQVAERIRRSCGPGDQAGRMGGDEFVLVLPHVASEQDARVQAQRLMGELEAPFQVYGHAFQPTASIGVSLAPRDSREPEGLLRQADLAMVQAKAQGPGQVAVFMPDYEAAVLDRVQIENDLREALRQGELSLAYQPLLDLHSGEVHGMEALLRWNRPGRGQLSPAIFVPIAESSGLIGHLGLWVLQEAVGQLARWQAQGLHLHVAVNVSAAQLLSPDFVEQVRTTLHSHEVVPGHLILEVTETLLMDDSPGSLAHAHLMQLNGAGVRVWVDDFGTGYSSLSYLHRLPIDAVKIDQSFVMGLEDGPEAERIVETIVTLGHQLGLSVIAEGVETLAQVRLLSRLGCDYVQGYLYAQPVEAVQVPELVRTLPLSLK